MDEQTVREILSGCRRGAATTALRGLLRAASWPYAGAMRLRRWGYRRGVLRSRGAGVPVLCVGNLTTGGTGKTPMVAWVVERLKEAGRSPAVLTRGYKADPPGGAPPVERGRTDEPGLLGRLTGVPVVVNPDRVAGARSAVRAGADVLVMDDGYQHRRLRRDLDIVLIDAAEPFGYGHCLPRGLLREPPSALGDAGAVVVTHSDEIPPDDLTALGVRLSELAGGTPIYTAVHRPTRVIDDAGRDTPLDALVGRRVFAFCGLGNPEHFFRTLSGLGARVTGRRALDDHAKYTPALLAAVVAEADATEAGILITTQKDHVKLAAMDLPRPVWQLAVRIEITGGRDDLVRRIHRAAGAAPADPAAAGPR